MSFVIVLDPSFVLNAKTFKIPTKVDAEESDSVMGLNDNDQEP